MNRLLSRQQGQGLVEYALILVLVAVVVIVVLTLLGDEVNMVFAKITLYMQYPGNYSGDPVTVTSVNAGATRTCLMGTCTVTASADPALAGVTGSPTVCAQFSLSGGGSQVACGSPPTVTFSGGGNSGSVNVCIIAVEGHSLVGGPHCSTATY